MEKAGSKVFQKKLGDFIYLDFELRKMDGKLWRFLLSNTFIATWIVLALGQKISLYFSGYILTISVFHA